MDGISYTEPKVTETGGKLMAGAYIPVQVGGIELLVETTRMPGSEPTSSRPGDIADHVRDAFLHAQSAIVEIATSTVTAMQRAGERAARPDAMEVEFGLKFSAQGKIIVAGASAEATLKVKLTYNRRGANRAGSGEPDDEES